MYIATEILAPLRTLTVHWPYVDNAQSVTMFILYALKIRLICFENNGNAYIFWKERTYPISFYIFID